MASVPVISSASAAASSTHTSSASGSQTPGALVPLTETFVQTNSAGSAVTTPVALVGQVLDNGQTNFVGYDNGSAIYIVSSSTANVQQTTLADGHTYYVSDGPAPAGYLYVTGSSTASSTASHSSSGAATGTASSSAHATSSAGTTSSSGSSSKTSSATSATSSSAGHRMSAGAALSLAIGFLTIFSINL